CRNSSLLTEAKLKDYQNKLNTLRETLDRILNFDTYGRLKNFNLEAEQLDEAFEAWPLVDKIKTLRERAEQFGNLASYLEQAQMYIHEQAKEKLYNDIEEALHKLPSKLNSDEIELKKFEAKLKELKDRYAIYYLTQYEKYRL